MSTKVLTAPAHSSRWTSCGRGHGSADDGWPLRRMMYVPIRPVKNMISVARKIHMASLPLVSGGPMCRTGSSATSCVISVGPWSVVRGQLGLLGGRLREQGAPDDRQLTI